MYESINNNKSENISSFGSFERSNMHEEKKNISKLCFSYFPSFSTSLRYIKKQKRFLCFTFTSTHSIMQQQLMIHTAKKATEVE
jgi:hypothetical protein